MHVCFITCLTSYIPDHCVHVLWKIFIYKLNETITTHIMCNDNLLWITYEYTIYTLLLMIQEITRMCRFLIQLRNATNLGTVPTPTKGSSVPTNVRVGPVAIDRKVIMLRLLKNVRLSRYLSTAARPAPERNPAILYTGVSIVFYCACVYWVSFIYRIFIPNICRNVSYDFLKNLSPRVDLH